MEHISLRQERNIQYAKTGIRDQSNMDGQRNMLTPGRPPKKCDAGVKKKHGKVHQPGRSGKSTKKIHRRNGKLGERTRQAAITIQSSF